MANPGQYANWMGVLRWSLRYSDGTRESNLEPMTEERKAFLQEVFDSMTVDESKRMVELCNILTEPASEATSDASSTEKRFQSKLDAMEELIDIFGNIDNAKNMFNIGVYEPILRCISDASGNTLGMNDEVYKLQLQSKATEVLTTVLQNNPLGQTWALERNTLETFSHCIESLQTGISGLVASQPSSTSLPHMLAFEGGLITALSALVRDNFEGQRGLLRPVEGSAHSLIGLTLAPLGSYPLFIGAVPSELTPQAKQKGRRLVRKVLFFLRHLVRGAQADAVKSELVRTISSEASILTVVRSLPRSVDEDDVDCRDARQNAVQVLTSLLAASKKPENVADDGDRRSHKVVKVGQESFSVNSYAAPTAESSESAAAPIALLTDEATVPAQLAPPVPSFPALSMSERIAHLVEPALGLQSTLSAVVSWTKSQAAACASSGEEAVRDEASLYSDETEAIAALQARLQIASGAVAAAAAKSKTTS